MQYVLAVDGGGTKTHCMLYNLERQEADLLHFGATNHEILVGGLEEMRQRLRDMTGQVMTRNNIEVKDIVYSVWGMAGLDTKSQHAIINGFIKELGFKDFTLCNDAYLCIKAGLKTGYGICLLNGTGYNVAGINHEQKVFQVGGQFEITGDFGGGLLLGKEAVKTTFMNLFRYRTETILTRMVMDEYEVTCQYEFMDRVTDWANSGKMPIPHIAKCVFDAANAGDLQAVAMLERMAEEYALSVKTLLEELSFDDEQIEIVLAGSLFTKRWSDIHLSALQCKLKAYIPQKQFALRMLEQPPVIGALSWALEKHSIDHPLSTARNVMKNISKGSKRST